MPRMNKILNASAMRRLKLASGQPAVPFFCMGMKHHCTCDICRLITGAEVDHLGCYYSVRKGGVLYKGGVSSFWGERSSTC